MICCVVGTHQYSVSSDRTKIYFWLYELLISLALMHGRFLGSFRFVARMHGRFLLISWRACMVAFLGIVDGAFNFVARLYGGVLLF
jgi:hypothetical protein